MILVPSRLTCLPRRDGGSRAQISSTWNKRPANSENSPKIAAKDASVSIRMRAGGRIYRNASDRVPVARSSLQRNASAIAVDQDR